jgi:hypothetical protein
VPRPMNNRERFDFCSQYKIKHENDWFELRAKSDTIEFENIEQAELFIEALYEAARSQFSLE